MHDGSYVKPLITETEEILTNGSIESWTELEYKSELTKFVNKNRMGLEEGTTKLNEAKTLLEKILEENKK